LISGTCPRSWESSTGAFHGLGEQLDRVLVRRL